MHHTSKIRTCFLIPTSTSLPCKILCRAVRKCDKSAIMMLRLKICAAKQKGHHFHNEDRMCLRKHNMACCNEAAFNPVLKVTSVCLVFALLRTMTGLMLLHNQSKVKPEPLSTADATYRFSVLFASAVIGLRHSIKNCCITLY